MDSVTQIVLGSTVALACAPKQLGKKAAIWGAVLGTLPDLDVLIPMGDAVADFTYHRSFSHSLLVLTLLSPLFAWLIGRIHDIAPRKLFTMVWLALITHPLLDSFTTYGTQLFWPLFDYPVSLSSVFIIDPFYTLPLLAFLIAGLRTKAQVKHHWLAAGLAISTGYLFLGVGIKQWVESRVETSLQQQGIHSKRLFSTPAPFSLILWRAVAMEENGYREVYVSLFDKTLPEPGPLLPQYAGIAEPLPELAAVERLRWFTHGFYKAELQNQQLVMTDLRMGMENNYVFSFVIANCQADCVASEARGLEAKRDPALLGMVWQRMWDQDVSVTSVVGE